jgi:SAM-dependent methyltransferase
MNDHRKPARDLAAQAVHQGKPLEWFETLYRQAQNDESAIPWADMIVNPNLSSWLERQRIEGAGRKALVVGCGLGDDSEALAPLGFQVTAFDISPTCIEWCKLRFPNSSVEYSAADLFLPPPSWQRAFNFVLETYTLQVLPDDLRTEAIRQIAGFVAVNGTLLVISRGRSDGDDPGTMPWPLLRGELAGFNRCGLREVQFEDYVHDEDPPVRRFRVEYSLPIDRLSSTTSGGT